MNRMDDDERDPVLDDFEAWLRKTRPLPDGDLAAGVMRAIRAERLDGHTFRRQPWRPRPLRAWARFLAPAAAALAVVFFAVIFMRAGGPWSGTFSPTRAPHDTARAMPDAARAVAVTAGEGTAGTATADGAGGRVRCVFEFADAGAHEVCLVGSFNRWTVCNIPLVDTGDGTWSVTLELPHGRYEYMFVVDGRWITDPAADRQIDDGFGRKNALLLL